MQTIALGANGAPAPHSRPTYRAPWGTLLRCTSLLVTAVCLTVSVRQFSLIGSGAHPWASSLAAGLLLMLAGSALFTVRSYALDRGTLVIERLLWSTRIPLAGLLTARYERKAIRGCLRTFGNGGAFSFTGWYWSSRFGFFRAFVTDLNNTVILRFPERTIVVSPERPQEFAQEALLRSRQ